MIRTWLSRLALLGISLTFALGLAEAALRWFSPGYSPLFLDIYRMDDHGLVLLQPGTERRHVSAEWRVRIAANADGLRDRAVPAPDSGGSVLGVGDSFAFGWGVEFEEAFLTRAEELLRPKAVRIVKAGIPGAGPSDYARFLEHYGAAHRPDIVVASVFVGNDFTDVQMGGLPGQFAVRNGVMVKATIDDEEAGRPSVLARLREKLKTSSLLAQQVAQAVWLFEQRFLAAQDRENPGLKVRDRWLWEFAKVHLRNPPPETEQAFALTNAALDSIADWCDAHGARLLLVILPRSIQVYPWELARWREAYGLNDGDLDLDRPQRVLTSWASSREVPVLDLLPAFREHAEAHADDRLYFYPNSHMNARGHGLAGSLLAAVLQQQMAPGRPTGPDR